MNEQNRYRGSGSQQQRQGQDPSRASARRDESSSYADRDRYAGSARSGNEWDRDYGHRSQRSETSNPDYARFDEPAGGSGYSSGRSFERDEFARDWSGGSSQGDRPFREQDRDYRGGSSGYGSRSQHEWSEGGFGSGNAYGSGSSYNREGSSYGREGSYGSGSYGREGSSYGSGSSYNREGERDFGNAGLRGRSEIPWGARGGAFSENRGPSGPSYGRSSSENSIANFGNRTRQDVNLSSGAQSSFYGRGPKGYARSDERIREDVCERLSEHDEVDASDVEVTVKDREVTLTGTVETRRMKHLAEDIADSISGVEDVHNRISVRKPFLKDMADRIMGDETPQHHAHSGTKNTSASAQTSGSGVSASSSTSGSTGATTSAQSGASTGSTGGAPHYSTPVANGR